MVRPRLLFVDDEVGIRKLVEQYLELSKEEYDVFFAHSGEEAIKALERYNPLDLLITDIRIPEIDGWELIDISRNDYNLKTIITSAFGTVENLKRAYEYQVSDFFIKPFKFKNLFASIKRIIGEKPSASSTIEKVNQPAIGGEKKITYHTVAKLAKNLQPVQQVKLVSELLKNFDLEQLEEFQLEIPSLKQAVLRKQEECGKAYSPYL
jgi:YesN/AraC family two-component response regulator